MYYVQDELTSSWLKLGRVLSYRDLTRQEAEDEATRMYLCRVPVRQYPSQRPHCLVEDVLDPYVGHPRFKARLIWQHKFRSHPTGFADAGLQKKNIADQSIHYHQCIGPRPTSGIILQNQVINHSLR